jgi:hypothetical protein
VSEGHVGVFYRSVGIQVGVVRTHQQGSDAKFGVWTVEGFGVPPNLVRFDPPLVIDFGAFEEFPENGPRPHEPPKIAFDETTNDLTVFGVFRKAGAHWGVSVGAGAYFKEGIPGGSPLRFPDDEVVFSGFVTANVSLYKGLGIDVSYWHIGATREFDDFRKNMEAISPNVKLGGDAQSRWTVGVGYSF